jgi:hypothetical protein
MAARTVHGVVGLAPTLADETVKWGYHSRNMDVLGYGYHSTAIKVGASVYKLIRSSAYLNTIDQEKLARNLTDLSETIGSHLDIFAPAQTFSVSPNPFGYTSSIVIGSQEYVEGFRPIPSMSHLPLEDLEESQLNDFRLFSTRACELLEVGLAVDISANNVGFGSDGRLHLVDTTPITQHEGSSYTQKSQLITSFDRRLGYITNNK